MPKKYLAVNEKGRRIGEHHHKAVLTDHEVELLMGLLDVRETFIEKMKAAGSRRRDIDLVLTAEQLSYRCLADKFEIHKQTVAKYAKGERRCQTAARWKPYP